MKSTRSQTVRMVNRRPSAKMSSVLAAVVFVTSLAIFIYWLIVTLTSSTHIPQLPSSSSSSTSGTGGTGSSSSMGSSSSIVISSSSGVASSSSAAFSSSSLGISSSSLLMSSSSGVANTACDINPCRNGGTCVIIPGTPSNFVCQCISGIGGTLCDLPACNSATSQLVTQTTITCWNSFVDPGFVPTWITPILDNSTGSSDHAFLLTSTSSTFFVLSYADVSIACETDSGSILSVLKSAVVSQEYVIPLAGSGQTSRMYLLAQSCQGLTATCVEVVDLTTFFAIRKLTVQQLLSTGMYFYPGGASSQIFGAEIASDYANSTWLVLYDSQFRLYLSRWSPSLNQFYGYQNLTNLSFNQTSIRFAFDEATSRLYIVYPHSIWYVSLNPILGSGPFVVSNPTFYVDAFSINPSLLGDPNLWLNQNAFSFALGNGGYPWLALAMQNFQYQNETFWVHLGINGTFQYSDASVFGYPYQANATFGLPTVIQSSPWGDMGIITNGQVLIRTCQAQEGTCDPVVCGALQGTCVYHECRCPVGTTVGLYAPQDCVDVNECLSLPGCVQNINCSICSPTTLCMNYFNGYGCNYAGSIIPTWRSLMAAGGIAQSGWTESPLTPWVYENQPHYQRFLVSFVTDLTILNSSFTLLQSHYNATLDDRNLATELILLPVHFDASQNIVALVFSYAWNNTDLLYSATNNLATDGPLLVLTQISTKTLISVLTYTDLRIMGGSCTSSFVAVPDANHFPMVNYLQSRPDGIHLIFSGTALDGPFSSSPVVSMILSANLTSVLNCTRYTNQTQESICYSVANQQIQSNSFEAGLGFYSFSCYDQFFNGSTFYYDELPVSSTVAFANTSSYWAFSDASPTINVEYTNANVLRLQAYQNRGPLGSFTVLPNGLVATDFVDSYSFGGAADFQACGGVRAEFCVVYRDSLKTLFLLDGTTGTIQSTIPIVAQIDPLFPSLNGLATHEGVTNADGKWGPDGGVYLSQPNTMWWTLGVSVFPISYANMALMRVNPEVNGSPCFTNNGGCNHQQCVETISGHTRCDVCRFFQSTTNFSSSTDMNVLRQQDPTFVLRLVFSDPFRTPSDPLQIFAVGTSSATTLYQLDLETHTLVRTITTPLTLAPIVGLAMNRDTHSSNLYVASQTIVSAQSSDVIVAQIDYLSSTVLSSLTTGQLLTVIPSLASFTSFSISLFSIDTVRVVWILFSTNGPVTILSKWNANLTLINAGNVSHIIPSTLNHASFSYDFHWIFWNNNSSYPLSRNLLGGVDYVPEYLADLLYTNVDFNTFPSSNRSVFAFDTSPFGYTWIIENIGPISPLSAPTNLVQGYQLNLFDNDFRSIQTVPLYVTQNSFLSSTTFSRDVPSSLSLTSFGDLFVFLSPSQTVLRLACQR